MSAQHTDLIDQILSITPGSRLDVLRRHREVARENIQKAYVALFQPRDVTQVTLLERLAVASFVAGLHGQIVLADHYAHSLSQAEDGPVLSALITGEIEAGQTEGPYGIYPAGPLSAENKAGPHYRVGADARKLLGDKLSAALEHAHLLVFRPRDASREALQALLDAGWSTSAIVTLSQLVAYLAFQVRMVDGLTALASASEQPIAANSDSFTAALAAGNSL
ncbi:CMD domain protein, Avi_7170 family [Devosia sp. YR412]|uniref:CMD domain protein n=1 Tax=Devosia sp. YR412 TaxID=1881030 RepID=UPI0008BB224F|nr:CMD domain protein [Devosia sp. YR412]SEQ41482.1 CMD domain protein, Avi_7170 family [Devosia sp. YR412]